LTKVDERIEEGVLLAGDLMADGRCSPQCLLALGDHDERCKCRCGGTYHGVLVNVPLTPHGHIRTWYEGHHGYEESHLASIHANRGNDVGAFNRFWRQCKTANRPAVWVAKPGRRWAAHYDTWTIHPPWPIGEESASLIESLVIELIRNRHAEYGAPGPETGSVHGLRTEREARIAAAAFEEALYGN
jgi:hypothetical protein